MVRYTYSLKLSKQFYTEYGAYADREYIKKMMEFNG